MIKIDRKNILPSGAIAAYSENMPDIGQTMDVYCDGKEGHATVAKTTMILGGQLCLIYLDVDWTSFDRIPDGE